MMQRRSLTIVSLLVVATLLMLAEFSYGYVRYYQMPSRLYVPPRTEQVDNFINALRAGNQNIFRYVDYELLRGVPGSFDGVCDVMVARAGDQNKYFIDWLTDDNNEVVRGRVIRAILAGLKNMDPRVRLTSVNLLRRLRPDSTMQMAVKQALARETVASEWEYWRERNIDIPSSEKPWLDAMFWDEDETFGYENNLPYYRRYYGDRDQDADGNFWGYQEGPGQTNAFNGSNTFEDTRHQLGEHSDFQAGNMNWADPDVLSANPQGWYGAAVPSGGSWYRPEDDIKAYVGNYSLKYLNYEYDMGRAHFIEVMANPWAELYKLDMFITRAVWYNKIKQGQLNSMVIISKDTFKALWMSIDGESPERIPFPSTSTDEPLLDGNDIEVLIRGILRNPVITNRWMMVRALKYIYRMPTTTNDQRVKIIRAIRRAKYDMNKIDIYRGDELYTELVGETLEGLRARATTGIEFYLGMGYFNPDFYDEKSSPRGTIDGVEYPETIQIVYDAGTVEEGDEYYEYSPVSYNPLFRFDNAGNLVSNRIDAVDIARGQQVIEALKDGDKEFMSNVNFVDLRNAFIITLYKASQMAGDCYVTEVGRGQAAVSGTDLGKAPKFFCALAGTSDAGAVSRAISRETIISAALGAVLNSDPRVRLTGIHLLRRSSPDGSMRLGVEEALGMETVMYIDPDEDPQRMDRGHHEFIDVFGRLQNKEARVELVKLYNFIIRTEIMARLETGRDKQILAEITRSKFETLTTRIDNEEIGRIPLLAFDTEGDPYSNDSIIKPDMIPYVVNGIYNPNFLTQKETAEFLIMYYNEYVAFNNDEWRVNANNTTLDETTRNTIINALLEAEEDDIVVRETTLLQTGEPVDGRAVILMIDPDTGDELPLSKAITTRRQWENAKALRDAIGGVQLD